MADTPIGNLTTKLNELWPIKMKGAPARYTFKGMPKIEEWHHKAMEQGRMRESDLNDALLWIKNKKQDLLEKIKTHMDINKLLIHGETISDHGRALLFASDAISAMQTVQGYMSDITGLISAVTYNLGILSKMEQDIFRMIQSNLNALSMLLNEICNWGLPDIPSLPNLFSDTIWRWNGFNFMPLDAFKPKIGFDTNFTFGMCNIRTPNLDIFRNYPSQIPTEKFTYGTPFFVPPLGGHIANKGQLVVGSFITEMQTTKSPVWYDPAMNPWTDMQGSLPKPTVVINDYSLTAQQYEDNVISTVEPLLPLVQPTPPSSDEVRKLLMQYVTLEQVVDSGFEKNLTAAWLYYLDKARGDRDGEWIPNYQKVFADIIAPSVTSLRSQGVPWNNVLGNNYVVDFTAKYNILEFVNPSETAIDKRIGDYWVKAHWNAATQTWVVDSAAIAAPANLPFVAQASQSDNLLWKLSYIEAAILGYPRSKRWDDAADDEYVSAFTMTDLDYQATGLDLTQTESRMLGMDTADYPLEMDHPVAIATNLSRVIDVAARDIEANPSWRTSRPQFRFVYDIHAQAKEIDRFSQFWREFNANLNDLLKQEPYLVSFVVSYMETLNSAINPLADKALYNQIRTDALTRNRAWKPGYPLLSVPVAPALLQQPTAETPEMTGWNGDQFFPSVFMERPDVKALPIPAQIAMLRTNANYASMLKWKKETQDLIDATRKDCEAIISDFQNVGFQVSLEGTEEVPASATPTLLAWKLPPDFDHTGFVTSATEFTIQKTGVYSLTGSISWGAGGNGTRTVTVFVNDVPAYSNSTELNSAGDVILPLSLLQKFSEGDVITVKAIHNLPVTQSVLEDSSFTMVMYPDVQAVATVPDNTDTTGVRMLEAATMISAFSAISVDANGKASIVDPTVTTQGHTPFVDGISLAAAAMGTQVAVGTVYGNVYQVPGLNLTVGGLLYVAADGSITQDYNTLVTQVPWVVCVGKALTADTFLYEPHIPTRFVQNI